MFHMDEVSLKSDYKYNTLLKIDLSTIYRTFGGLSIRME